MTTQAQTRKQEFDQNNAKSVDIPVVCLLISNCVSAFVHLLYDFLHFHNIVKKKVVTCIARLSVDIECRAVLHMLVWC